MKALANAVAVARNILLHHEARRAATPQTKLGLISRKGAKKKMIFDLSALVRLLDYTIDRISSLALRRLRTSSCLDESHLSLYYSAEAGLMGSGPASY